jgi:hypothetical protein
MAKQAVVGPAAARVRNVVWRLMQVTGVLRTRFAPMLAGKLTRLPDLLFGVPEAPSAKPSLPVTRAPAWVPQISADQTSVFRVVTTGPADSALARKAADLGRQWPDLVVHETAPRRETGFLLVRPDGFVAARGRTVQDLAGVERSLLNLTSHGGDNRDRI